MLKFLTIILSVLLFIFPVYAMAESPDEDFSISISDSFTTVYEWDKSKSNAANKLGMSETELENYFEENDVVMMAVNSDNTSQLRLSRYKNDFSELTYNLSLLSDNEIKELISSITETKAEINVIENNGLTYITFSETHKDSGGTYTATHYITVFGGEIYRLSCYNPGSSQSDEMIHIFSSLKINKKVEAASVPAWQTLLLILGISVFTAVGAAMIIRIIKERKKYISTKESK